MRRSFRWIGSALFALLMGTASANEPGEDHKLVSRYAGSVLSQIKVAEFNEYKLVLGVTADGEFSSDLLKGKLTRIVYSNPPDRSTLEIFSNYQQSMAHAGFKTLFSCAPDTCGPTYARSSWGRFNGLFAAADGDPRYLSARIDNANGTAYVALMVGRKRTQLDIVEVKPMQDGLVVVDAAALASGIDRDGRISVYGILFDHDRAEIKPESKPALDEIAKLLRTRNTLKLFVVGHTDMVGALAHNRTLSEARAKAVVAALINDYAIAGERLEAHGVGPLAPTASNTEESGRARNRRVELVAR